MVTTLAVTATFAPDTAAFVFFPTFETGDRVNEILTSRMRSIADQRIPAVADPEHRPAARDHRRGVHALRGCRSHGREVPALVAVPLLTLTCRSRSPCAGSRTRSGS
ncbi:MAG: hypothetical protein R2717_09830 [Schumannella sp.]